MERIGGQSWVILEKEGRFCVFVYLDTDGVDFDVVDLDHQSMRSTQRAGNTTSVMHTEKIIALVIGSL